MVDQLVRGGWRDDAFSTNAACDAQGPCRPGRFPRVTGCSALDWHVVKRNSRQIPQWIRRIQILTQNRNLKNHLLQIRLNQQRILRY